MKRLLVTLAACALCPWTAWAEEEPEPEAEVSATEAAIELPSDLTAAQRSRIEQCKDHLSEAQIKDFIILPQPQRRAWLDKHCPTVVKPPVKVSTHRATPNAVQVGPSYEPMLLSRVVAHSMFWPGLGFVAVGLVSCGFASEYCKDDPGLTLAPTLIVGGALILGSTMAAMVHRNHKGKRKRSVALLPLKTGLGGAWTWRF